MFDVNKSYKITQKWKAWFVSSLALVLAGAIVMIFLGLNLGIDFTGGTKVEIEIGQTLTDEMKVEIKKCVDDFFADPTVNVKDSDPIQFIGTGDKAGFSLTFTLSEVDGETVGVDVIRNKIIDVLLPSVDVAMNNILASEGITIESRITDSDQISQSASSYLIRMTVLCSIVSCFIILIYIAWRFELISGIATIITLAHDILVVIVIVAFIRLKINSTFVAALITIIAYSINNTIIIFDRIRENIKKAPEHFDAFDIANRSIAETLLRTINTSATTLIMLILLAILGVSNIQVFVIPIIIGLVAGFYSSLVIAPSIWAVFTSLKDKRVKGYSKKNAVKISAK